MAALLTFVSLEALGLVFSELECVLPVLVLVLRQVWLSLSSMSEMCGGSPCDLSGPGLFCGSPVHGSLGRTFQGGRAGLLLAGLRRVGPPDEPCSDAWGGLLTVP